MPLATYYWWYNNNDDNTAASTVVITTSCSSWKWPFLIKKTLHKIEKDS